MIRVARRFFAFVVAAGFASSVIADVPRELTDRLLLPKSEGVQWHDADHTGVTKPLGTMHSGMVVDLHHTKDNRHWIGRGWVSSDDVVTLGEAVPFFTARIEKEPTAFDLMSRARAYYHLRQLPEAVADCTRVLKLDPRHGHALSLRARCQLAEGDIAGALWDANQAVLLDPEHSATWYARAHINFVAGDIKSALPDVQRALKIDPHSTSSLELRGRISMKLGNPQAAIDDFTAVLKMHPTHVPALNNRANVHFHRGDFELADADYSQAIKLDDRRAELFVHRGIVRAKMDRTKLARADFVEALRLEPTNKSAQSHLDDLSEDLAQASND